MCRMKSKKHTLNIEFLLNLLSSGKSPAIISKELNISKQNLNYYLRKLKEQGYIKKIGYGVWEIVKSDLSLIKNKVKEIRGHAFIWVVKVPQEIKDWKSILDKYKLEYKLIGKEKYPRIYLKGLKVWLCKKNIVVWENKSFYAINSINARKYAVIKLIEVLELLQKQLRVKIKPYIFKPKREHYGMIKNELARQYNRQNKKLIIHDDLEGNWLWIDDSDSLGELEAGGLKAIIRSKQVQDWWNDHKKHNFELNTSKTLELVNGVVANQVIFDKNMMSHISAIQTPGKEVRGLGKAISKVIKENKELRLKVKDQRTLSDF